MLGAILAASARAVPGPFRAHLWIELHAPLVADRVACWSLLVGWPSRGATPSAQFEGSSPAFGHRGACSPRWSSCCSRSATPSCSSEQPVPLAGDEGGMSGARESARRARCYGFSLFVDRPLPGDLRGARVPRTATGALLGALRAAGRGSCSARSSSRWRTAPRLGLPFHFGLGHLLRLAPSPEWQRHPRHDRCTSCYNGSHRAAGHGVMVSCCQTPDLREAPPGDLLSDTSFKQ